jgi:redox-sensing transcriptional repressor
MTMAPEKTLERLILYQIVLEQNEAQGVTHLFSKDLAIQAGSNPAQVRRDLMTVGYNGNPQKGYAVGELIEKIRSMLQPQEGISMALVGVGNLGRAILGYFTRLKPKFNLVAAFDTEESKVGRVIAGARCYHSNEIETVLRDHPVSLGVITVPETHAQKAADQLVAANIRGIVNFAPVPIRVPAYVYLENMHMTLTFEKVAYFARAGKHGGTI